MLALSSDKNPPAHRKSSRCADLLSSISALPFPARPAIISSVTIQTTAAILAGGQSTRMGVDKAFVNVSGQPLVERVLARVEGLADETLISANQPDAFAHLGLPVYPDILPGKAALGGIYTAISKARGEHVLVVAVDMPFLNRDLLAYLLSLREGYDVVAPRLDGYPQATHAVYGKACLDPIRRKLDVDRLKIIGFYDEVRVRYVDEDEMRPFDPDLRSLVNVNTPADLSDAQRLSE